MIFFFILSCLLPQNHNSLHVPNLILFLPQAVSLIKYFIDQLSSGIRKAAENIHHGFTYNSSFQRPTGQGLYLAGVSVLSRRCRRPHTPLVGKGKQFTWVEWSATGGQRKWEWGDTRDPSCNARCEQCGKWHCAYFAVSIHYAVFSGPPES